jgi:hypothetical protein
METTAVKKNDKVVIVGDNVLIRAIVTDVSNGSFRWRHPEGGQMGASPWFHASQEGEHWCRGWTGRGVAALKKVIHAKITKEHKEKREHERAEEKREREHDQTTVKRLQQSARMVKAAKLPRELHETAFQFCLMRYSSRPSSAGSSRSPPAGAPA